MASSNSSSYPSFGLSTQCEREASPECFCGEKCIIRTVKKETTNKGRKFWGCRHFVSKDDPGCSYMKWIKDPWPPQTQTTPRETECVERQHGVTECADCSKKGIEIGNLRQTIKEMKNDVESTKNLLKIALYSIFLLVVALMLVVKSGKSV